VLGPLLAALVAAAGIAWGLVDPPPASPSPVSPATAAPEASALLGGLSRGDRLVGWDVTAVAGPDADGVIRVDIAHGMVAFALMLAPLGSMPEAPPVQTEHWAIYYGHVDPADTRLPRNVVHTTTNALANLVRAHE
jgi:hypothetical protein